MSRLRLAVPGQPTAFVDLGPASAHLRVRSAYANVPAVTIPDMRPVLTFGGLPSVWRSGYKQKALTVKR